MDVSLALLIISASVLLIGFYLASGTDSIDGDRGDHALETVLGSTVTITYDLSAPDEDGHVATDSEHFVITENFDPDQVGELYEITTYGSAPDLLGEAALTNLRIDGEEPFAYGHDVEESVDGAVQDRLIGSRGRVYAVATWEPYDGASIAGRATAGSRPPASADISGSSTQVSGAVSSLGATTLASAFSFGEETATSRSDIEDGFDSVGYLLAEVMVEAYFPPEETQYALESTLTENAVTQYNYRTMAEAVGVDVDDEITGTTPSAFEANAILRGEAGGDDGLAAVIADDLRESPAGRELRETYDEAGDGAALETTFEEVVSTGTIDITVQTWDE